MVQTRDDEHIEVTPREARGAGIGKHLFVILAISTAAVSAALFTLFVVNASGG